MAKHEPRNCVVCGKQFVPTNSKNITCSKECSAMNSRRHEKERREIRNKTNFENGDVYALDMKTWTWHKKVYKN